MTTAIAALVSQRGGPVALAGVRLRPPGPGEVLVRICATGVCATDLFAIDGGVGDIFPAVLGHEGAGVVEAVGPQVTSVLPGDHVVLGFDSCGRCAACAGGHPASCAEFASRNYAGRMGDIALEGTGEAVRGAWMSQSSWATRVVVRERSCAVIPSEVPWEVAATLGCGVLTGAGTVFNVLAPGAGDSLLVLGAGTTGLAAIMAAAHRGVGPIIACEPSEQRRRLALELGATEALTPQELAAARVRVSHAVDTVGTPEAVAAALDALAPGGTCATVALKPGANPVTISQSRLLWGRRLVGVVEGDAVVTRDVARLVALWRLGRLPVERLVRRYRFADVAQAVEDARTGAVVKPVLCLHDDPGEVAAPPARDLLGALRDGVLPDTELAALWGSLPSVAPGELRGLWRGRAATRHHRVGRMLERSGWYGKLFVSDDEVAPIIRRTATGTLVEDAGLAHGGASLRTMEHDGLTTAAMVYDGQPVIDLFVRLAPDAVLGVMTGRQAADDGVLFHFVLQPDDTGTVVERSPT